MKTLLILIVLLSSCESKRAANKIEWLEEKGYLKLDSIYFTDTVKGWQYDTIVQFDTTTQIDTLTIEKNGIKTITVVRWKDRVVSQNITVHDTIRHIQKPILKEVCPECKTSWWHNILPHLGLFCFVGLMVFLIIKFK